MDWFGLLRFLFILYVPVLSVLIYIIYSSNYNRVRRFTFKAPVKSFFTGGFVCLSFAVLSLIYLYIIKIYANSFFSYLDVIVLLLFFVCFLAFMLMSMSLMIFLEIALSRMLLLFGIYDFSRWCSFVSVVLFVMVMSIFEYSFFCIFFMMIVSFIYVLGSSVLSLFCKE